MFLRKKCQVSLPHSKLQKNPSNRIYDLSIEKSSSLGNFQISTLYLVSKLYLGTEYFAKSSLAAGQLDFDLLNAIGAGRKLPESLAGFLEAVSPNTTEPPRKAF